MIEERDEIKTQAKMNHPDDFIINLCLDRVSKLFKLKKETLCFDMIFGVDIAAGNDGWPKEKGCDELSFDIELFASSRELKMMEKNEYRILTLGDYCDFMLKHYKEDSDGDQVVSFMQDSLNNR